MSKKVIDCHNYISRSSSHSMIGSRRGFLNILPRWAKPLELSENILEYMLNALEEEYERLRNIRKNRRLKHHEDLRLQGIKGQIGNINKIMCLESENRYNELHAWVFYRLCCFRLERTLQRQLDIESQDILNKALINNNTTIEEIKNEFDSLFKRISDNG